MSILPNSSGSKSLSRRQAFAAAGAVAIAANSFTNAAESDAPRGDHVKSKLKLCLNTSTVRGHKLSVPEQIKLAADAGYDGIELWMRDLAMFTEGGGKLQDIRKQLNDTQLIVPSAIGFAKWIVDDDGERAKGLEEARRDMGVLAEIGALRIAAPPTGVTDKAGLSLDAAAERYAKLLELGREMGIVPQLELWGFSKNLFRLGQLAYVAAEAGHDDACVLPDVYHIYKGGSDFRGLQMISPAKIHVFHINDYPADPPQATIKDADRVYPGDGIAPLKAIFGGLVANGFNGVLSLELFNPTYYQQDAKVVAQEGIEKMRAVVAQL
jgi:2-keto-myo-inositol isomerase